VRVILDSNVIIAGVASRGLCEAILELCLEHHHVILCESILEEIEEKLRVKIKVSPSVIVEYLKLLRNNSEVIRPEPVDLIVCRDPNDLPILGLVIPGNADAIVTGDNDLLVIREYKSACILTPRSFWDSNKKENYETEL
jgi:putative PIN family toxin of toxin-antitoxin system